VTDLESFSHTCTSSSSLFISCRTHLRSNKSVQDLFGNFPRANVTMMMPIRFFFFVSFPRDPIGRAVEPTCSVFEALARRRRPWAQSFQSRKGLPLRRRTTWTSCALLSYLCITNPICITFTTTEVPKIRFDLCVIVSSPQSIGALIHPPITYYWTVPLILDHSYLVGKSTSSKIADTKVSGF
jgi:hypothetical protein